MRERVMTLTRDDFRWDYFRAGGKGGQPQNKLSTGVRCTHPPSGAVGEARDARSQLENRRAAFKRCVESDKFRKWIRLQSLELSSIENMVDKQMQDQYLKIEHKENGLWKQ